MFKKLLSNLPYNPSLIGQVSFYSQRLKRESVVRRAGLITVALAVFVQTFAFISPPQQTLANSNNDMISGGISSKSQAVDQCTKDSQYRAILAYYGISCESLNQTSTVTLKSTDYNKSLFSMGHLAYGKAGETPVSIPGVKTMYLRYLHSWDSGAYSTYTALKGTTSNGKPFFILYNCGNLTFVGLPTPPPAPKPDFTINKTVSKVSPVNYAEDVTVATGERVKFKIEVKNTGQTNLGDVKVFDTMPRGLVIVPGTMAIDGVAKDYNITNYISPGLAKGGTRTFTFDSKVTATSACGTNRLLNESSSQPDNLSPKADSATVQVCTPVQTPTPPPVPVPTPTPTTTPTPPPVIVSDVCPTTTGVQTNSTECKPCENAQSSSDLTACIEFTKTASNTTKNIVDANNTTANANDVIKYTLTTKNIGTTSIKDYAVTENISDVLDYATVVDLHGGTIDNNNIVTWPAQTLAGTKEFKNLITVKIKDPIPSTPISSSDPGHYDMKMTNVYGNTVSINLPPTIVKTTEVVTTTVLPNTGPGTTLLIGFTVVFIATFFLSRSTLMRRELQLVQQDFATTGGY